MNEEQYRQEVLQFYDAAGEPLGQMSMGVLALAASSGQVAHVVNGVLFEGQQLEVVELKGAVGKVLRSVMLLCDVVGCSFSEVMESDVVVLRGQGLGGAEREGSANREDASFGDDYCFVHTPGGYRCAQCQEMLELIS
ncbi:MAG: hypothetical protein E6J34_22105 [Chloroflexi bacterium]|nr:MAG: hypothetical protein E6J34_22105 [Chloroflexota bacterium]